MHTDIPITLRLEHGTAAIVGSGRPESFTLYHLNGNYVAEDSPGRTTVHEPQAFLGISREVISEGGELIRLIDHSRRWRPSNINLRNRELDKWNQPRRGDLVVTGTIDRITSDGSSLRE